jgi:hypothetical protein
VTRNRTLAAAALLTAGLLAAAGAGPATAATPPPPKWVHIAAGSFFTCGIREGNSLWCWGSNADGQLGSGGSEPEHRPRQVTG